MNTITTYTAPASEIKAHVQLIQEIMKSVMKRDEHYGKIPGTKKDTLFLSGAQKLLSAFRLGSDQEIINTDETEFSVSYRVKVRLFSIVDGNTVGYGTGECSSLEDKYAFKKAISDAEYNSYPENRRRVKFYRDYSVKQVAVNYKDVANTILKMATKRALVSATLTATAAGDIFTQDLEDMEPQTRDSMLSAEENLNTQAIDVNVQESESPATLKEIMDSVKLLGNKSFTKEEDGKTLLFVAGNCFLIKDTLKKMGFLYRKPQGAQYGETYMDVTHLDGNKSNPLGKPTSVSVKTIEDLEGRIEKLGLAIDIVTIEGVEYAEVIGSKIFENKEEIKALGFKWSSDDSKSWRFNMTQLDKTNTNKVDEISRIRVKAEIFGFEVSEPVINSTGTYVQATPVDGHGDAASLRSELGFQYMSKKDIYVLKLSA